MKPICTLSTLWTN